MTGTTQEIAVARAESVAARAQLSRTLGEIQGRVEPKVLMREGVDRLRERASVLATATADQARARPALAGAVVGGGAALPAAPAGRPAGRPIVFQA